MGNLFKKEIGITLIALIITIVVTLILVAVTLSVTLGENGLVDKAEESRLQMQIETDREELLSAVVGAIGIDGKVDFTYLDSHLPKGFTGSNGNYTSKNGNSFTVSANGEVKYVGNSDIGNDGELEDSISIYGKYYLALNDDSSYYEIRSNNTMAFVVEGEEYLTMPVVIDTEKQTITAIYEIEDPSYDQIVTETMVFNYEYVIENNKVTNTIIIIVESEKYTEIFFQNDNGFKYDLDGVYKNEEKTKRYTFDSNNHTVIYEYYSDNDWIQDKDIPIFNYYKVNNRHYLTWGNERIFTVSEDYNTVTIDGNVYTKVISGEEDDGPEPPPVDYSLLGTGDIITGYAPTAYTSSNPYTVSLPGCSGSFSTQDFQWKVTSVSGDTITMKANGVTSDLLSLTGANGWNNSLTALENICSGVYAGSTSKYTATARSINFADMNSTITPASTSYSASTYGANNKFPTSYLTENHGLTDISEDSAGCGYASNSSITVTNTSFIVTSSNQSAISLEYFNTSYWVDKKCVVATSADKASFSVGWVNGSMTTTAEAALFDSSGTSSTQTKSVRPVVTLTISDWTCLNTTDDGTNWTISND